MAISPAPPSSPARVRERARIERFVHQGEGGFRIAELRLADGREAAALGRMGELQIREIALLEGTWVTHDRYGEQLRVDRAMPDDLRDPEAVRAYLALTPHVTHRRLHALLDAAGDRDPLAHVDEDPVAAFTAAGMSERHAASAALDWKRRLALRRLRAWLQPRGLGRLVPAICARGGTTAAARALADPYLLAERYEVPLATVDELVADEPDPKRRAEAAVICVLRDAARSGHTGLPDAELGVRVAELDAAEGEETLDALRSRGAIRIRGGLVQPQLLATQEDEIADALRTLAETEVEDPITDDELAGFLTDEQRAAVHGAFARRLTVIVGGPGTGKSTLIGEIVALAERHDLRVGLCAPTGKAARRLTQTTGREAQTIHSLAKVAPPDDGEPWDVTSRTDPRLRGAGPDEEFDVLVCDEASMLTCELAVMLLACLGDETHLVLVGDADQLPPVGPGDVLEAIVGHPRGEEERSESSQGNPRPRAGGFPAFELTEIKRQADDSIIPVVARMVLRGERPELELADDAPRDFWLSIQPNAAAVHERAVALASGGMAGHLGVDPVWGIQVLAPTNHELDVLNGRLQRLLNPDGRPVPDTNLRVGDKLLQTLNAREQGLVNGDLLRLDGLERGGQRLRLAFEDGTPHAMTAKLAHRLRPAYAMTAHRAQGSEFPGVIVVLTTAAARPLNRNWLYTAITRAQRACVVVAEERALDLALDRGVRGTRLTALGGLLGSPTAAGVRSVP
jgi:exodeoxyribonuclease V alpha subunit